jgi:cell division protein YceG involved in septum cleavage
MPKGALHHIHTTASPSVEEYIKITYDPCVAFNEREGLFKVLLGKEQLDGYLKCTEVRQFYKTNEEYDSILREAILLTDKQTKGWKATTSGKVSSQSLQELVTYASM